MRSTTPVLNSTWICAARGLLLYPHIVRSEGEAGRARSSQARASRVAGEGGGSSSTGGGGARGCLLLGRCRRRSRLDKDAERENWESGRSRRRRWRLSTVVVGRGGGIGSGADWRWATREGRVSGGEGKDFPPLSLSLGWPMYCRGGAGRGRETRETDGGGVGSSVYERTRRMHVRRDVREAQQGAA